jgi:hypothetical protein
MAVFDLEKLQRVLPRLRAVTTDAAGSAERLIARAEAFPREHPERLAIEEELHGVIETWAEAVSALGGEAKGLWLVDFDNGEGYYCWRHPETSVEYWHPYDTGFTGRRLIEPEELH